MIGLSIINFSLISPWLVENRISLLIYSPLIIVGTIGVYAITAVIYGVTTFNDCQQAKEDLMEEIVEAKSDLRRRKIIE